MATDTSRAILPSLWRDCTPTLQAAIKTADSVRTVQDIVALTTEPKLAKLAKEAERTTRAVIVALIINLASDLHIDNGLTERNIESIADRLTTDGELKWWLTLADVDLLCRRIASGYYGKFYNHFSEVEFNECLAKYCQERTDIHRQQADRAPVETQQLGVNEVGYTVDAHGNIKASAELAERRLPQPLYVYDDKGRRIGENPKGAFGKKNAKEVAMQRKLETVKAIMKEDRTLDLDEAIERVEKGQL